MNKRLEVSLEQPTGSEELASHVSISNFGSRQGERVLVRKWQALVEQPQRACEAQAPLRPAWQGFTWPLGLLAYHFIRR